MVDLNEMVIFARVVEIGTFSGAARAMGLPKSTVSRKVAGLEARLGTRLLQRTTRSVKLTELGAAYYERCAQVVADAQEAERAIAQRQSEPSGRLKVSIPVEFGRTILAPVLMQYLAKYPQVRVEVDISDRFVDLVQEGFDLAIRAGVLKDSTLVARRLGVSQLKVSASAAYLQQHGTPQVPQELCNHPFILYGTGGEKQTLRFSGPRGLASVTVGGRLVVNNMGMVRDAVVAGQGLAVLPDTLCKSQVRDGEIKFLLPEWKLPEDGIYAVYPSPRHLSPKVRSFIDYLAERVVF